MSIPASCIRALSQERLVPFVGSGVSLSVRKSFFPTWPELLLCLADELEKESKPKPAQIVRLFVDIGQLNKAADEALDGLGNAGFARIMLDRFNVERPPDADLSLVEAVWRLSPRLIVTTNYDDALRWANPSAVPVVNSKKFELSELFTCPTPMKPWVWHLHGHVSDIDSLILAPQQYERLYRQASDERHPYAAAWQQLRNLVSNHPLLFIGFGLQDQYVMECLSVVLEIFARYLKPSYALLKADEVPADDIWRRHNIQVIEFGDYGQPLVERVEELGEHRRKVDQIGRRRGGHLLPAKPNIPTGYLELLSKRCGTLELLGLKKKEGQGIRLSHVYTPLTTTATVEREEQLHRAGEDQERALFEREQNAPRLLLKLFDRKSLYVSGDPGSGKSTFCRWVAWLTANQSLPPADVHSPDEYAEPFPEVLRNRLPLLIPLRDFWHCLPAEGVQSINLGQFETALQQWLAEQQFPDLSWDCLQAHLAQGSAVVMLDGVDEVPTVKGLPEWYPREMLLVGLSAAVEKWVPLGNRILVTSRPYGLNEEQRQRLGLPPAPISGLDPPLQELLVQRWFYRLSEDHQDGLKTAADMIAHIRDQRGLDELAANPLLLTSMCIIYDEGKRLPQDKHELYDRIVDTVLHKRYPAVRERVSVIRGRLAAVALGMHTAEGLSHVQERTNPEAVASEAEVDIFLQRYRQQDGRTEQGWSSMLDVREDLLSHTGLLVSRDDRSATFYHLSFQEFLAAERLFVLLGQDQSQLLNCLLQRCPAAGWRNTLSFLFGCQISRFNTQSGIQLLERLIPNVDISTADAIDEASWNQMVVLGDCLEILDARGSVPPNVRRVFEQAALRAIDVEAPLQQRFAAAIALGRLGDPRIVTDLRDRSAYVEIPAGTYRAGEKRKKVKIEQAFLLSRYPVTNGQYALFVEEDGYNNRGWWSDEGWQWLQESGCIEPGLWRSAKWNCPNQPVVSVSYWEAEAFASWAGARLPKAIEWEAAARGPKGLVYPWGNDWEDGICNSSEAGLGVTSPVGIFPRSRSDAFGLDDMAGNVWEWCQDEWASDRVFRGGCWAGGAEGCRSAYRCWSGPEYRGYVLGFRVAAVPPSKPRTRRE